MMYKRLITLLLVCTLLMLPLSAHAAGTDLDSLLANGTQESLQESQSAEGEDSSSDILLVYPDDLSGTDKNSLSSVVEILTFLGHSVDYVPQQKAVGMLSPYDAVVCYTLENSTQMEKALADYSGRVLLLGCLPQSVPNPHRYPRQNLFSETNSAVASYTFSGNHTFTQLLALNGLKLPEHPTYTAGTLFAAGRPWPLVSGWDSVRYLPMTDYTTAFAQAVLEQEIALWLWQYKGEPHSYAQHIVLDCVYPFSDPVRLLFIVQNLVKEKIDFVISVMPIYNHADFPAMQQLCEVLRYAQANGGAVILHAPIVQGTLNADTLQQKLTDATQSYFQNQVYPIALEIPRSWMYREDLRSTLGRYRTLFVYNDGSAGGNLKLDTASNDFVQLGTQLISPSIQLDGTGAGYLDCCATAVYIDSTLTPEQIMKMVDAVRDSPVPLKSLWDMEQEEYLNGGGFLHWDGDALLVNGERVSLDYVPQPRKANYDYKRTVFYRATANLQKGNHVLILFVAVAMAVFALSMFFARRQMHRRFFYDEADTRKDSDRDSSRR